MALQGPGALLLLQTFLIQMLTIGINAPLIHKNKQDIHLLRCKPKISLILVNILT